MTNQCRDISRKRYLEKMQAHGFTREGIMGYWRLPIPGRYIMVSDLNAGDRYRTKLAYMLKKLAQETEKHEKEPEQSPAPTG